jgi:hypothetical protein
VYHKQNTYILCKWELEYLILLLIHIALFFYKGNIFHSPMTVLKKNYWLSCTYSISIFISKLLFMQSHLFTWMILFYYMVLILVSSQIYINIQVIYQFRHYICFMSSVTLINIVTSIEIRLREALYKIFQISLEITQVTDYDIILFL